MNTLYKAVLCQNSFFKKPLPQLPLNMFQVTPVPDSGAERERKVSFSPDIDESYRHQVVDKIKGLMDEVQVIHEKEEKHMKKFQENEHFDFKQKQQLELDAFLKRQREEAAGFQTKQTNVWNDLKERHTQETWRLFGRGANSSGRGSISNLWGDQKNSEGTRSSQSSPFSPKPPSSPVVQSNPWPPSNSSWNSSSSAQNSSGAQNNTSWNGSAAQSSQVTPNSPSWNGSLGAQNTTSPTNSQTLNYWNKNS